MHINVRNDMHNIAADSLPCGETLRVVFFGMSWQKYAMTFRGGGIWRCHGGEISRKKAYRKATFLCM